jgi:RNA-directed DNA polymerase
VLEPIFERNFAAQSYGFRPGRGCKEALRRVDTLLKQGYSWVVDADLKSYFDTIPHAALLDRVGEKVADGRVLGLVAAYLTAQVMETAKGWTPEGGTPQGAVISPLLSNIYLDPLDHLLAEKGYEMVRYADDFVILCRSEAEGQRALDLLGQQVMGRGLSLHPEKTRLVDMTIPGEGFDFLGYHFEGSTRWPRKKSLRKVKDALRSKTPRSNGHSLQAIIEDVNQILRGWFEYFKHSHTWTFSSIDQWTRRRLRSILRRRRHHRGISRGFDHQRWPNVFFRAHGLFSLADAHRALLQSPRG